MTDRLGDKINIVFEEGVIDVDDFGNPINGFIAIISDFRIVEAGKTKENAFNEAMRSLIVLFAHNGNIESDTLNKLLINKNDN